MALRSDSHKQSILSKFDKLRKRDLLCDITLVAEDVHFKAHKALLAASSEYFSLMFTAEDQVSQPVYRLDGVAAKMFAAVLEFIYSAQVSVEVSAMEQLLATARLVEVNDLVKVLSELKSSAAEVRGEGGKADIAEAPHLFKRRRGRPKKKVDLSVIDLEGRSACESSEEMQAGDEDCDDVVTESQPEDDAEYIPGAHRQSKRKIRPPLKFKSFKVGGDTAGSKEPGRRGRKRKYPSTEARCEDCDKVFKNHLFLKIHQRTHTGNEVRDAGEDRRQVMSYPLTVFTPLQERSPSGAWPVGRPLPRSTRYWLTSAYTLERSRLCVPSAPKHSPPNTPYRST